MKPHDLLRGLTRSHGRYAPAPFQNPPIHSPIGLQDHLTIEQYGPSGELKKRAEVYGNVVATYGLNRLCELCATGGDASDHVAAARIGTDNTAASSNDSRLLASTQSIALSGASMDASDQGNRTLRYVMTFASDGNASQIREIAIYASSNVTTGIWARRDLTGAESVNRGASDEIRVSWDFVFTTA